MFFWWSSPDVSTDQKFGAVVQAFSFNRVTQVPAAPARVALPISFGMVVGGVKPTSATQLNPSVEVDVAFADLPLAPAPAWVDVSSRTRTLSSKRGRAYEFDRMETGTVSSVLSNRDAALSPANTSSPYNPVKSNRPYRVRFIWGNQTYAAWRGISEGYPQAFPSLGKDALVELRGNDLFYALNNARFSLGALWLATGIEGGVAQGSEETISVTDLTQPVPEPTGLPMPQVVPFTITVGSGLIAEEMTVTEIVSATQYRVTRTAETTYAHIAGSTVTTKVVSFGEALSGERIRQILERVGFDSTWYDLDEGQSLIADSPDLASVNPLEHINLVTECEFGRFYVRADGKFAFRDRHSRYVDSLSPVLTFVGGLITPGVNDVPYRIDSAVDHSDEKLYNHVRITIPSGEVVEMEDAVSIGDHFIHTFEREWPYANVNDAESAARYILSNASEDTLRLPTLSVRPAHNPSVLWPLVLVREIGERVRFRYQPEGGGSEIDKHLLLEGVGHQWRPGEHVVTFQATEVAPTQYWVLGKADYSELGTSTRVGF